MYRIRRVRQNSGLKAKSTLQRPHVREEHMHHLHYHISPGSDSCCLQTLLLPEKTDRRTIVPCYPNLHLHANLLAPCGEVGASRQLTLKRYLVRNRSERSTHLATLNLRAERPVSLPRAYFAVPDPASIVLIISKLFDIRDPDPVRPVCTARQMRL